VVARMTRLVSLGFVLVIVMVYVLVLTRGQIGWLV
jgi:hypothetical protein